MNNLYEENNLQFLCDIINDLEKNNLTESYLEEIIKNLMKIVNIENLIDYRIREKGNITASFEPQYKFIRMSVNRLNNFMDANQNDFKEYIIENDYNKLRGYFLLFALTHEIEHSRQYLMGEKIITAPNEMLSSVYKDIMGLFTNKNYILPRPIKEIRTFISLILYKRKQNFYVLERNANVESLDIVRKSALYNEDEEISILFNSMKYEFLKCGYESTTEGVIEETYRELLMYDKYKRICKEIEISEEDRVRYGFNIDENTRTKLLQLKKSGEFINF